MNDHYFSKTQDSPLVIEPLEFEFLGRRIHLSSASGVFSRKQVDRCTQVLMKNCEIEDGQHILDLGCGYGPLGVSFLLIFPNLRCDFSDVNSRAVKLAKKNLKDNSIDKSRYDVYCCDGFSKLKDKKYDAILLNPPQTAGRKICNRLIEDAKEHLKKGGSIQVVARHNKGGSEFEKFMREVYGNCDALVKKGGVRVYKSVV